MRIKTDDRRWSELDALEDNALGMFVGGLLLKLDADALSREPAPLPNRDIEGVETFLDSIGVRRISPDKAASVEEMRKEIVSFFEANAEMATLAARNFKEASDEAIKSIYDELVDLRQRSSRRG